MSRFKTQNAGVYRSAKGVMKVLKKENPFLYQVEVWLLNGLTNRNNWRYENLEQHKALFADTPILVAYVNGGNKVGDGHNFRMKRDKSGEEYASFTESTAERIVGWFPDQSNIRIEEKEGTKWIVGVGYIWTWYARELVDMLEEQGADGMEISIETLVDSIRYENNTEVFDKYEILGTTILGKGVTPAVAGAKIRSFNDLTAALNEFKLRVASEQSNKKGVKELKERMFDDSQIVAKNDSCVFVLSEGKLFSSLDNGPLKPAVVKLSSEDGEMEAENAFSSFINEIDSLKNQLDKANKDLEAANEKMDKMQETEKANRKASIIEAVKNKAKKIQENADSEMDENICNEICENADQYVDSEDEEGNFNGDKKACADLAAKCMEKMLERKSRNSSFQWNPIAQNNSAKGGIEGLLERINK